MSVDKQNFPLIRSVFHPTDFSEASNIAFAHALKISLIQQSIFNILHVATSDSDKNWADFTGVRDMLVQWGLIAPGSGRSAVYELGIELTKVISPEDDPVHSSMKFLGRHPADLVVLAPHHQDDRMGWLHSSVSEPLARNVDAMTLFIPHGVSGFVSLADGSMSLTNILVPIDVDLEPASAINTVSRFASALKLSDVCFTLLYVGDRDDLLAVQTPERDGWVWKKLMVQGDVVNNIIETADSVSADLIIMSTQGHNGFLDALRGSTTERVMRNASCPLLALPTML